jgi:NADPH2:quinone reductase
VIGRVSNEDKIAIAKDAGADHVIVDTEGQFAREAIRLSGGEGVHVVYDGSGPLTFQASLDSLRRCGTFCWYGPVLGGPGALDIMSLPRSIKIGYANFVDQCVHTDAAPNPFRPVVRLDCPRCPESQDWRYLSAG